MEYILQVVSGLVVLIPLVVKLIEYVQKATKEKNWNSLLNLTISLMEEAECKFENGADKREWVIGMIQASANTINYDISTEEIGTLIDNLCAMTKVVNPPVEKVG